ncbi:MAG: hypothetical protein LQ342_001593 [Letrouitia transgressa]|nr:MAG: hypothetical protein LQ342_001593 [Letrouitia transgressa]
MADMSLHELFQRDTDFKPAELYAGMFGLAEALSRIHEFTFEDGEDSFSRIGYHHDLKPANILVRGRQFMISDFGLSKMKPSDQTSRTRLKGGSEDYLSPEAFQEADLLNGRVGRAHDIWAFGCVLTEFMTYIEMGKGSVDEFKKFRSVTRKVEWMTVTDSAFHLDGLLRPAVDEWLGRLNVEGKDPQSSQLIGLAREMLNPSWQKRMTASNAAQRMSRILFENKINHLRSLFLQNSYDGDTHTSNVHVLIWLEERRFKVWSDIYILRLGELNLPTIDRVLSILTDLQHALEQPEDEAKLSGQLTLHDSICQASDTLYELLPSHLQTHMNTRWLQTVTELNDMEQLAYIQTASKPQRYRIVGIKAAMKHICLAITKSRRVGGRSMLIEKGLISLNSDSQYEKVNAQRVVLGESKTQRTGGRVAGTFESESGQVPVVIEWKNYDRRWTKKQGDEMFSRVEALAKFLSPEETPRSGIMKDKILECLGYFHDEENWKFGFVYAYPPPPQDFSLESIHFYSLNDFIRSTDYNDSATFALPHPLLGDIFRLVQGLVKATAALHEVGWLHKNISSHNVITFSSSKDLLHKALTTSVLAGWDESRPEDSTITFGPNEERAHYQHPRYRLRKTGFRRTYDYFSLGIVLLEIGLWVTVVELWRNHPECQPDVEAFRKKLLTSYVPQIGERMGAFYRDAVSFCLDADSKIQQGEEGSSEYRIAAQDAFQEHVVNKLSCCRA